MIGRIERFAGLRIVALAAVVLLVQFGLVQHSIEAGPQHTDTACEFCVAGDHHTPLQGDVEARTPVPAAALLPRPAFTLDPASTPRSAHRVRGPPTLA